jgi:hypothetical protein
MSIVNRAAGHRAARRSALRKKGRHIYFPPSQKPAKVPDGDDIKTGTDLVASAAEFGTLIQKEICSNQRALTRRLRHIRQFPTEREREA